MFYDVKPSSDQINVGVTFMLDLLMTLPRHLPKYAYFPTEIRVSPTKPCGKGSKRKQAELDEDEDEEESQTWVEALNQELVDDEDLEVDPDYEVSAKGQGSA